MIDIDFTDPRWRFEERVVNLVNKGTSREEAERVVRYVIETKEQPCTISSSQV